MALTISSFTTAARIQSSGFVSLDKCRGEMIVALNKDRSLKSLFFNPGMNTLPLRRSIMAGEDDVKRISERAKGYFDQGFN
jgi:hypothetical protein